MKNTGIRNTTRIFHKCPPQTAKICPRNALKRAGNDDFSKNRVWMGLGVEIRLPGANFGIAALNRGCQSQGRIAYLEK
jgi:hypothetical protein